MSIQRAPNPDMLHCLLGEPPARVTVTPRELVALLDAQIRPPAIDRLVLMRWLVRRGYFATNPPRLAPSRIS